jgi:hypothetical protein
MLRSSGSTRRSLAKGMEYKWSKLLSDSSTPLKLARTIAIYLPYLATTLRTRRLLPFACLLLPRCSLFSPHLPRYLPPPNPGIVLVKEIGPTPFPSLRSSRKPTRIDAFSETSRSSRGAIWLRLLSFRACHCGREHAWLRHVRTGPCQPNSS